MDNGVTPTQSRKGLATNRVGLFGAVVIGISCIAPTYTLTSGLGPTISAVGTYVPAVLLLGFIPMLLVAFAYRELNNRIPDSGTSFTWATQAFGPWVGWMGGWGLIVATILVMSNLAAVAVDFFFLTIGQLTERPEIADLTNNLTVNIPVTLIFIAVAAWVSYRGLETTEKLQYILVAIQIVAIVAFDIAALRQAYNGHGFDFEPIQVNWFNPLSIGSPTLIAAGISLSIFMFWGWDVTLTMNEETKDPGKTPGRAATLTVLIIIVLYIFTALAVLSWAGTGDTGLGASNSDNQESIFAALSYPVMGKASILIYLAVLASSFASLQSTMVGPARTLLAMGHYRALPPMFSKISPQFKTPSTATFVSAIAAGAFYTVTRLLSENALWDTIATLGLMICFYYGITAVACIWFFRKELFSSAHNIVYKFMFPALGGGFLLLMFVITAIDSMNPEYGSGTSLFGVGTVFVLGLGILGIGVILMLFTRLRHPAFFRGETLRREESTTFTSKEKELYS
ncbi:APC family permease [Corynebacterium cystitidis]|uniref:Amino acid/polyamine/organocation transporter, APC superfamily n=1 Tax=Corynebacterium cystitidis DSM 20524 TaxID=1121357 RepID=A0A1H9QR48_9CORY|nr:APC family permease [Corynebacterium cystitidis]WJY81707.1 Putrescine importer PuuP [Corynebacterium cystitidis DSM 20524]SER62309.1 amino acid/polyamine/organocation transporter, APC superfamily [Corynebacterium cystitidis DSM 20524]SNV84664.1 putative amino acid transporter [Corynebacterium cystitidis]